MICVGLAKAARSSSDPRTAPLSVRNRVAVRPREASRLLTSACGFPVIDVGVVVWVRANDVTGKREATRRRMSAGSFPLRAQQLGWTPLDEARPLPTFCSGPLCARALRALICLRHGSARLLVCRRPG